MTNDLLDDLLNPENDVKELENIIIKPLLEAVESIHDGDIRSFVRAILMRAPDHFWEDPSSYSGKYHPPDERGYAGNIIHTTRVARISLIISQAQEMTAREADILLAASLLHDLTKGRCEVDGTTTYDPMHPYTLDRVVSLARLDDAKNAVEGSSTTLTIDHEALELILRLVRCHMGIWSPVAETIPISAMEWALHFADLIASRLHIVVDGPNIEDWRWDNSLKDET
jgi:hypothetical protein